MVKKLALLFFAVQSLSLSSQINILNSMFNAFNVNEESLLYANIMNNDNDQSVYLEAKLFNGLNQPVLTVRSSTFILKKGLTNTASASIKVSSSNYTGSNDAQYIKTMHQLPSGKFKFCLFVVSTDNSEGNEFCDEFENEANSFLFLITPPDKDTIDNKTPILLWNHSDPFNLLKQGEMYRMLVSEIKTGQNADAAINVNYPVLKLDFLTRHDIQYPFDGYKLEDGKRYGWQVQKVVNNVVVNKTEAWEFIIRPLLIREDQKYVEISQGLNTTAYVVSNQKLFFTFKEEYSTSAKNLAINIIPENENALKTIKARNDLEKSEMNVKQEGENKYMIDFKETGITSGYYYLKITNEKGQVYQLKFFVN